MIIKVLLIIFLIVSVGLSQPSLRKNPIKLKGPNHIMKFRKDNNLNVPVRNFYIENKVKEYQWNGLITRTQDIFDKEPLLKSYKDSNWTYMKNIRGPMFQFIDLGHCSDCKYGRFVFIQTIDELSNYHFNHSKIDNDDY